MLPTNGSWIIQQNGYTGVEGLEREAASENTFKSAINIVLCESELEACIDKPIFFHVA